jgi:hypothetical protein
MKDDLNPAQVYRQHADELRSLARAMRDREIKRELFAHASDYERWAKERERRPAHERDGQRRFSV